MIKKTFLFILFFSFLFGASLQAKQFVIMLDPAAGTPESNKCAEILKTEFENAITNTKVILSHLPGQDAAPLQCASFANWAGIDLFIRIDLYKNKGPKPSINVYHLVMDPVLDFLPHQRASAQFIPLANAHYQSIETSKMAAGHIISFLRQPDYLQTVHINGPYGIPFAPLVGITAPAIALEFGGSQWQDVLSGLVRACKDLIENRLATSAGTVSN